MLAHLTLVYALPEAAPLRAPSSSAVWMTLAVGIARPTEANARASAAGSPVPDAHAPEPVAIARAPRRRARSVTPRAVYRPNAIAPAQAVAPAPASTAAAVVEGALGEADAAAMGAGGAGQAGTAQRGGQGGLGSGAGHGPGLLAVSDPCRGYFPSDAKANHAKVRIEVQVDPSGRAHLRRLLLEAPSGQGFGVAARACAAALRFAPAVDGTGAATAGDARLELHFHRS